MKLIRLTDDRFALDAGPDIKPDEVRAIRAYWQDWWNKSPGQIPEIVVFGGAKEPLEYEDRRDSDIERRVAALEAHVHGVVQDDRSGKTVGWSGPPEEIR